MDTRGYLYRTSFNPFSPATNLITEDDDSGGQLQFLIRARLESNETYVLVVTTHRENVTGSYSVSVGGPAPVVLLPFIATTTTTTTSKLLTHTLRPESKICATDSMSTAAAIVFFSSASLIHCLCNSL
jgi:hypothetical protein